MWYIAKLIFQIKGEGMQKPQFDEHLRLIEAPAFEEAFLQARIFGINSEDSVMNQAHGSVCWEFVNVADIQPVKELKNGMELYSQVREVEEAASYINYIHHRAVRMRATATAY
ncbi:MAG: DUF4288 domain-containing protein [Bacteroidetes bacterium]|nr:DUF4288 domain-containing protein [Bacteroidota bacterium]